MRRTLGLLTLIGTVAAAPAYAQQTPEPMTCEQRVRILTQLAGDVAAHRSNAEIEAAALKVQVQALTTQIEAASKKVAEKPAETKAK